MPSSWYPPGTLVTAEAVWAAVQLSPSPQVSLPAMVVNTSPLAMGLTNFSTW